MTHAAVLPGLGAHAHRAHALHAPERTWGEKNCYVDLWIELLHALRLDPLAMFANVFAIDFEGDQWTFYKPQLADLRTLYGIDVQELTVWRPLLDHAVEHLGAGKWIAVEVDAWWLPDTAGTDYRHQHTKTTVVLNEVDTVARRLGYFHNTGHHVLEGEDFEQVFARHALPAYAELVRLDRIQRLAPAELRARSMGLFREHLAWRAVGDPVRRFSERFGADLERLQGAGLPEYHQWAFAGLRQLGADAELAASYLHWLAPDLPADATAESFDKLASLAKTLLLKAARAVNSGRAARCRGGARRDGGLLGRRDGVGAAGWGGRRRALARAARVLGEGGDASTTNCQNRLLNVIRSFSRFIWNRDRKLFPNRI